MTALASSSASMSASLPTAAGPSASTSRLEPLLLLARSTKPRRSAAANLIHQAISTPGIYFFGELFDIPGIAELSSDPAYHLLCLFAYGTFQDYLHLMQTATVPELGRDQVQKLRQLTLLSLASKTKALPYEALSRELGLEAERGRELEDLVIETMYAGLISGKLNELRERFEVHYVQGRDIPRPGQASSLPSLSGSARLQDVSSSLDRWQVATSSVIQGLQVQMDSIKSSAVKAESERREHHQVLLHNLVEAQRQVEAQQQQQQQGGRRGKGNAMEVDEVEGARMQARKKSAVGGGRGNKRSRA